MIYREAGDVRAVRASLSVDASTFILNYSAPIAVDELSGDWYVESEKGVQKRRLSVEDPTAITIFPKPPKLEIVLPSVLDQYYFGECVVVEVEITNSEEEEASVDANFQILDALGQELHCELTSVSAESKATNGANEADSGMEKKIKLGLMNPSERRTFSLSLIAPTEPTSLSVEIVSAYCLTSDPETLISKTYSGSLEVNNPLEADYHTSTYIHLEPWPNFFSVDKILEDDSDTSSLPSELDSGIARAWLVTAQLTSFASDDVVLDRIELECTKSHGRALYTISPRIQSSLPRLAPGQQHTHDFELVVHTPDPEERRPVTLDLALDVTWRRAEDNNLSHPIEGGDTTSDLRNQKTLVTTSLLLSPFIIPSPEPRAICSASLVKDTPENYSVTLLEYTIENPTMHFLTFSVAMEASEEFAFSGIKSTNFNLVPLSRHTVQYHVMPHKLAEDASQQIMLRPDLKITDVYFGQSLKVVPGDGVSSDREGVFICIGGPRDS